MPSSSADRNPVERLAEEFAERYRHGETPSLAEYVAKYPEHADEIRELFPALVLMERFKPAAGEHTGDYHEPGPEGRQTLEYVGDYHILREVGHGGMGVVYEAEQVSLGRHVALKVLPPQALLNPTYLERFRREARAAAKLHHSNIVPVFGVGECDGVHYYAMQFIQGEALDRVVHDLRRFRNVHGATAAHRESSVAHSLLTGHFAAPARGAGGSPALPAGEPPAPREETAPVSRVEPRSSTLSAGGSEAGYYRSVARIGLQAADALSYAHRHGVLHRDIKPSNLLLDLQGTVWITDFGLAKAEGTDELTHTGDIVGTLRFMAPERLDGHSLPQSDVYSLGLTLYELLTLRPAFEDSNKGRLIERVLREPPMPPRRLEPRIPHDLETVVLKCVAKDPAERYATAEALAEDLRRFLADRPIKARRTPWHERTWRWCRRNPVVATLSGVLLLLLTVLAVGGVILSLSLNDALGQAQADRDKARGAVRQGEKQLFESLVSEAKAQRFSGRVGQRFGTLESIRKAAKLARRLEMSAGTFDELRNLAITALALPDMHKLKEWEGWPEGSHSLAFDAKLERYARGDNQGNITVRRVADDTEIAHSRGNGSTVTIAGFDEGGQALILLDAAAKSRKRWRFGARASVLLGKQPALFAEDNYTILTADQKLFVTLNRKTGIVGVHDLASGKHLHDIPFGRWAAGTETVPDYRWDMHPWRHELAISIGAWGELERSLVRVLDLDQGTVQRELPARPRSDTHALSWHSDGRTLAVGNTQVVVLWDVPSGKVVNRITDHKGGALHVCVSRSSQLMSTYSEWWGGVKFWHPHTGKLLLSLPSMSIHPTVTAPDGRMYTYRINGTRLQLWATEPSPVLRVLVRGPALGRVGEYRRSGVHRDGRLLAVGSSQGVSLFDLSHGLDVGHLDIGYTLTAQFDPATGDLLTFGTLGLLRWPVHAEPDNPDRLHLGPPKRLLAAPAIDNEFRISRDGRTIAVAQYSRVLVLHAERPNQPVVLQPTVGVRHHHLSLSPNGQWVATGSHGGGDIHVWEARTGRPVKSLRLKNNCGVQFTPDGERLLVAWPGACRFWRVGTWEEIPPTLDHTSHGEFSPDGRLLASGRGDGVLRLVSPSTGRKLADLENPDQGRSGWTSFSPDGRLLIATNSDYATIHVWDLPELRRQLQTLDLDWDAAPYPAAAERPRLLAPRLELQIDSGGLAGVAQKRAAATQLNNEAWLLATGAPEKRDPARALQLIQQALRTDPDNPTLLNTFGVVQYRNGRFKEALTTLQKSLAAGQERADAFDLFFLAMCHARLGDAAQARKCFERAVRWWDGQKNLSALHVEELKAFRAEAERLLKSP